MKIVLNGETREVPGGGSLLDLLVYLGIDPSRVAAEMNHGIVRKDDWVTTEVPPDARIEVVQFVGGG